MTLEVDTDSSIQDSVPVDANLGIESQEDDNQKPMYNKIQVQDVVKREKQRAYEKGKREALMELQEQQQLSNQQNSSPEASQQSVGNIPQSMNPDDIKKIVSEQLPQHLQDHANQIRINQLVDSFSSKMKAAEERYPGLEEKLNDLDYESLAPVVQMANDMENTGDIMKELVDNPMKMGNLLTLMYTQPKMAKKAMMDLSNSIKQNQEALSQNQSVKQPMSQIKSSLNAGVEKGDMSVSDYRKMFRA